MESERWNTFVAKKRSCGRTRAGGQSGVGHDEQGVSSKDELGNRKVLLSRPQNHILSNCDCLFSHQFEIEFVQEQEEARVEHDKMASME